MIEFPDLKEGKKEQLKDALIVQRKWDGTASYIKITDTITLWGRNFLKSGERMNFTHRFPEIVSDIKAMRIPSGTSFIGELIVMNPQTGREDFQLLQPRITRDDNIEKFSRSNPAELKIYEYISLAGQNLLQYPYIQRQSIFLSNIKLQGSIDIVETLSNGEQVWEQNEGLIEGLVLRNANGDAWKLKYSTTQDVYCKGEYQTPEPSIKKGQEKPTPSRLQLMNVFANIRCYQIVNGVETFIGNIGGGFRDPDRIEIQKYLDNHTPFCIEIEAMNITNSGKFRMPRFKRLRPDKSPSQCVRK